jgi:hypothetical protein
MDWKECRGDIVKYESTETKQYCAFTHTLSMFLFEISRIYMYHTYRLKKKLHWQYNRHAMGHTKVKRGLRTVCEPCHEYGCLKDFVQMENYIQYKCKIHNLHIWDFHFIYVLWCGFTLVLTVAPFRKIRHGFSCSHSNCFSLLVAILLQFFIFIYV